MDTKKKVIKKKVPEVAVVPEVPAPKVKKPATKKATAVKGNVSKYVKSGIDATKLKQLIATGMETFYQIDVSPNAWVLPNRAKFGTWLDKTFKYAEDAMAAKPCKKEQSSTEEVTIASLKLFPHQKFIKDYIQFKSPYRGLLIYHGLGVGKSCTSIAAAEMLLNHMDVVVMVPASLRDNYMNEIRKCGRNYFQPQQHWAFVPLDVFEEDLVSTSRKVGVPMEVIEKHKGLWIPVPNESPNFHTLPGPFQSQIQSQLDEMIQYRFEFINYNGLTREKLEAMTAGGRNPFDGKCVIVDEIHNVISRISNQRDIGKAIYKLLMSTKNCKLIFLSGTPIINYPHEIAYLLNLITGYRNVYQFKCTKDSMIKNEDVQALLSKNMYVDTCQLDPNGKRVLVTFLPQGFIYENRASSTVMRESKDGPGEEKLKEEVFKQLKAQGISMQKDVVVQQMTTLPEEEDEFNRFFVNFAKNEVANPLLFMRRILGTVSYYSTYSPELYPSVDVHPTPIQMNDFMFSQYEKYRLIERKKESKGKPSGGNIFKSSGQVYRFYSRAICNFVFPKEVQRPFPSKLSQMKKEVDEEEKVLNEVKQNIEEEAPTDYNSLVDAALKALEDGKYLQKDTDLRKYSPKFYEIVTKIQSSPGTALVYSQFKKVEGLGLLASALRQRGYAPFKIKKVGTSWDVDMDEEDYFKPKYVIFEGSDEETRMLLKIFNSEMDSIPPAIREKLPKMGGENNFHGEIIKVMMITQSGAEGISLKNVRQVHVMEPYWNHIRIDQVVGRAVRTCSHIDLPPKERHVDVYIYYMEFSKHQKDSSVTIMRRDKGLTTDEYIYRVAQTKANIIKGFLEMLKKASIDCAMHAKKHGSMIRCFSFPSNIEDGSVILKNDINDEPLDIEYSKNILVNKWKGDVYITAKGNFLVKKETMEVYDYDIYLESGKLVKLGVLRVENKGLSIKSK